MKRYRQRAIDLINEIKSNPCADCGQTFDPVCMDFDHLGDKDFAMATAKQRSTESILKEVAKCDIVCSNCHRLRTKKRRELGLKN